MRISDWSSDVCSSDLKAAGLRHLALRHFEGNAVFFRQIGLAAQKNRAAAAQLHHLALHEGHLAGGAAHRSEEHTSELQSLMRISYAVFCLKKKNIYVPSRCSPLPPTPKNT